METRTCKPSGYDCPALLWCYLVVLKLKAFGKQTPNILPWPYVLCILWIRFSVSGFLNMYDIYRPVSQ